MVSGNPNVVKHIGGGKFEAVGIGTATIVAEYYGKSGTVEVKVEAPDLSVSCFETIKVEEFSFQRCY